MTIKNPSVKIKSVLADCRKISKSCKVKHIWINPKKGGECSFAISVSQKETIGIVLLIRSRIESSFSEASVSIQGHMGDRQMISCLFKNTKEEMNPMSQEREEANRLTGGVVVAIIVVALGIYAWFNLEPPEKYKDRVQPWEHFYESK